MASRHPDEQVRHPVSLQQWLGVALLHWRLPPAVVRSVVPDTLTVDTHDGDAWVSLTPFLMRRARLPFLPSAPWLSNYPETNLRTYVRGPCGRDGLWFLSLDVSRLPVAVAMRRAVGLPYRWSSMAVHGTGDRLTYTCHRRALGPPASSEVSVRVGAPMREEERDGLPDWLTGRWRAFSQVADRWVAVAVEHEPWPLRHAEVVSLSDGLVQAAGLPALGAPDLVHAADGVHARLAPPRPLREP